MSDDIKALLDKAFGPEPPLALDREAIVRHGRRQVRIRRLAASGGVAAAVVAVVLGAAFLSSRPGDDEVTPALPASTRPVQVTTTPSNLAPAGPELPLSTTTQVLPVDGEAHAAELTKILSTARVLPETVKALPLESNGAPLVFRFDGSGYQAAARLSDASGQGIVLISLSRSRNGTPPRCPDSDNCTELSESGVVMAAHTDRSTTGTIEYSVYALRPDGTSLTLSASNLASTRLDETRTTRPEPPVDLTQLRAIATLPGLSYR